VSHAAGVAIARADLPAPVSAVGGAGRPADGWSGGVDFGWPEQGVVGEFDGRVKYGRTDGTGAGARPVAVRRRPQRDPGEAVYREKQREG